MLYDPKVATGKTSSSARTTFSRWARIRWSRYGFPIPCYHPDVKLTLGATTTNPTAWHCLCKSYETPKGTLRQVIRETNDLYHWHKINRNTRGQISDLIDGVGLIEDVNPSRGASSFSSTVPRISTRWSISSFRRRAMP